MQSDKTTSVKIKAYLEMHEFSLPNLSASNEDINLKNFYQIHVYQQRETKQLKPVPELHV